MFITSAGEQHLWKLSGKVWHGAKAMARVQGLEQEGGGGDGVGKG